MKRLIIFLVAAFFMSALAVALVAGYGWKLFHDKGPLAEDKTLILRSGTGLVAISELLETSGIINNSYAFQFGVRLENKAKKLKAGEYNFSASSRAIDIMELLVSGKTVDHKITIPEGYQTRQIIDLVQAAYGLSGDITVQSDEGSMLPETYLYKYDDTRNKLLKRMQRNMKNLVDELWKQRTPSSLISNKEQLVTLASIVEKETALARERPHVAAVFLNRLEKRMRLQSDPTVIYGVTQGKYDLGRAISRADLDAVNDYNTYKIPALPEKPICNPGRASLEAVLRPLQSKSLYFVADGTGGHVFSESLSAHNRNVRIWRKIEKNKK